MTNATGQSTRSAVVCGVDRPVELDVPALVERIVEWGAPDEALRVVAQRLGRLADELGVALVLVRVVRDDDDGGDDAHVAAAVAEAAPGLEVRTERGRRPVAEELLAAAARHEAGLIAVGSRGRGPGTSALLGSVTATLLRRSDRPVLVVSRGAADPGAPE